MDKWKAIQDFTFGRIRDPETSLPKLAKRSGVSLWWLQRVRYRPEKVKDPGWLKTGMVFQALGGRAPNVPKQKEKVDGIGSDVQDQ
jgi:hypothetical protein